MATVNTYPFVENEEIEAIAEEQKKSWANSWRVIPLENLQGKTLDMAYRLNALGQLFFFGKVILRKHRLTARLHKPFLCDLLESEHLKLVIEWPRDHFKSTICSEMAPIWWALPFNDEDEKFMRLLGYGDEFITWMKRSHNPDTRTLLASENIENAAKLGSRIDYHYEQNDLFKRLFPEIQLDSSCRWSVETKTHKRTGKATSGQGEGTYDYIGAGGALQSRHYDRGIQDDLFGKKALESDVVMQGIIDWHRLLVGAFDTQPDEPDWDNDEIVVGNRWGYRDLNYWIRKNEPYFNIHTHSATGGCCPAHPAGQLIFPEEFSERKLSWWRARLGTYFYSCQFLNRPTPPGETKFKTSNLNFFTFNTVETLKPAIAEDLINPVINYSTQNSGEFYQNHQIILKGQSDVVKKVALHHYVEGGIVPKDVFPGQLSRYMVCDPNHAGEEGRSRHAIIVTGLINAPTRIYILETYAESSSHYEFFHAIFRIAEKWKMKKVHLETISGQTWLKFGLETEMDIRKQLGKWTFEIVPLKTSKSKDAKIHRIEALDGIFERRQVWMLRNGQENFKEEYEEYPHYPTKDILDVLGYSQEIWDTNIMSDREQKQVVNKGMQKFKSRSRNSVTGY